MDNTSLVLDVPLLLSAIWLYIMPSRFSFLEKLARMKAVLEGSSGHSWEKKLNLPFLREKSPGAF